MRVRHRFRRLASLATFVWIWATPSLLLPGLLVVPTSGCLCDCSGSFNNLRVGSSTAMSKLDVSGDGCGKSSCYDFATGGACQEFTVKLVKVGSCHLTATATDGRQASTDVTIGLLKHDCCGDYYTTDHAVSITFPGAGVDGGP